MRSGPASGSPGPESLNATSTVSASALLVLIDNFRDPSPTSLIASMAFMTKLRITCCNWTRSPKMSGSRFGQPRLGQNAVLRHLAAGQSDDLQDCFVDVDAFHLRRRLLGEVAYPDHDIRCPCAVIDTCDADRLPGLFQVWRRPGEPTHGGFGIGERRRRFGWLTSWAMEAVSWPIVATRFACAKGPSAHRGSAVHFRAPSAHRGSAVHFARDRLGALAVGQVDDEGDDAVSSFAERCSSNQHRHAAAAFAEVFLLEWLGGSVAFSFQPRPARRGHAIPAASALSGAAGPPRRSPA